jgi:hypothetical protein
MPVLEAAGPLVTDWFSFDTLEEDFTQFLISKGVESVEIPHLNKFNSSRLKWDEVWTRKAIHEIYEWHKVDIEYFGYPDNPFYPR